MCTTGSGSSGKYKLSDLSEEQKFQMRRETKSLAPETEYWGPDEGYAHRTEEEQWKIWEPMFISHQKAKSKATRRQDYFETFYPQRTTPPGRPGQIGPPGSHRR